MTALPRQPDDPGAAPETALRGLPLSFEPAAFGNTFVYLGRKNIGEIMPNRWAGIERVMVLFRLPDVPQTIFGCDNLTAAKSKIARMTFEWWRDAEAKP
jgi:hypothetical protein